MRAIALLVACLYLQSCLTTDYTARTNQYEFAPAPQGVKILRQEEEIVHQNFVGLGIIALQQRTDLNDIIPLAPNEKLVGLQIRNQYSGGDFALAAGLCLISACLINAIWTRKRTIITGDVIAIDAEEAAEAP